MTNPQNWLKINCYGAVIVCFMYVDVSQTALMLRVSETRVRQYLGQGRIQGAFKLGNAWAIPLFDGEPVITPGTRGPKFSWRARRPTPVN